MNQRKAIAELVKANCPECDEATLPCDIDLGPNACICLKTADAILETMKDPADEVLAAPGPPYDGKVSLERGMELRRSSWNLMIEHIMNEPI